MNEFFYYLIQSSGILAAFYVLYFLFLRNERFFAEIRWFLMMSIVLAVFLPLVKIPYTVLVEASQVNVSSDLSVGDWIAGSIPEVMSDNKTFYSIPVLLMGIYLMVSLVLLIRSGIKVWQIWSMIVGKEFVEKDNCKVILLDEKIPAFSFFGYVVINRGEFENEELRNIFIHEKVHALQKHWIDLLLVEILSIVFWFNPFVWLFQIAIKQTHELLADDGVIARGFGIGQYQAILINQLMGAEVVGLANNFNHSINKKRMIMMSKEKGPKIRRYKLLFMIPVVAAVLVFNMKAIKVHAQEVEIVEIQNSEKVKISGLILAENNKPTAGAAILVENSAVGTVSDSDGKFELEVAKDANIRISFIGFQTRKMAVEDFILNGNKENNYFLKIKLKSQKGEVLPSEGNDWSSNEKVKKNKFDENEIFVVVEDMPQFPGGNKAKLEHIAKAIKYPKEAIDKGIKGVVFVRFIVSKSGSIKDVKVIRGVHPLIDKEALRVIEEMPNWIPGKQNGKKVNVAYTLPVRFGTNDKGGVEKVAVTKKDNIVFINGKKAYNMVDNMPKFPGGHLEIQKFLARTLVYPKVAQDNGIQGRVFVSFIVNKDGKVSDPKIVRGVDPSLDKEAIRVVNSMPQWEAGKQDGKPVNVIYTVPINFKLGKGNDASIQIEKVKSE
ncbi:M56 family metallopeptidase [Marinifilum flexuosum]|uniref:Outer membrane transport energization protein TonB n=1 Tax=Marinifilum flexuosum TaxID=1117708 RepID=A0A419X455_9BACT|nr:M56 family metallopeptidase [Marinifilum flexuosum]RKE02501.1 outer membrane transport energization protein TonB [Marinifilum flexuosum]